MPEGVGEQLPPGLTERPEHPDVDGDAGRVPPVVPINNTSFLPQLDADEFCKEYHLGDDIRGLLKKNGFYTVNSLFERMLSEKPAIRTSTKREFTGPQIMGGRGGQGGDGGLVAGRGGTGMAPQMELYDGFWFSIPEGGIDSAGDAGGVLGVIGTGEQAQATATGGATLNAGPALESGLLHWGSIHPIEVPGEQGEVASGQGLARGGAGGFGGQFGLVYVALFKKIVGGGAISPTLIFPINKDTRRLVPHTPLEDFNIRSALCQRLTDHGFQTVGGSFQDI
ncbi:hypothetical protein MVEN_00767500 [Mycena venus]|uniref:Uncharacterized protein n=1 Tax=Mycena venus TaxID=2733690 RepID=A0A8H6YJU4_9AGAR|nr:hypothetical protein MVEN_00767500 [Mycena venus]